MAGCRVVTTQKILSLSSDTERIHPLSVCRFIDNCLNYFKSASAHFGLIVGHVSKICVYAPEFLCPRWPQNLEKQTLRFAQCSGTFIRHRVVHPDRFVCAL